MRQTAGETPDRVEADLQPRIQIRLSTNRRELDRLFIDAKTDHFAAEHALGLSTPGRP